MDHYSTLGVNKDASPDDIKRAYRKLASQHHPDKGGDKAAFQKVQQAYETLSDPNKRQQYDNPQPQGFQFDFGGGNPQGFDFSNIFEMFGARFNHGHPQQPRQHQTRMSLWIKLEDVATGGRRPVAIGTQQGTQTIDIDIPFGINDVHHVQNAGLGPNKTDLIIQYRIHPNPKWHRNGLHLTVDHQVSIYDCLVGGETTLTDIAGNQITVTIPPLTNPGSLLRLKGRGLPGRQTPPGDLLVRIQTRMPRELDPNLVEMIKSIQNK